MIKSFGERRTRRLFGDQVVKEFEGIARRAKRQLEALHAAARLDDLRLPPSNRLEKLTGLECRVTILGYVQRGGTPSAMDRLLATRLGTACADLIEQRTFGVMVAARGDGAVAVPLDQVAGKRKPVPPDHPWIAAARAVGTCLGD